MHLMRSLLQTDFPSSESLLQARNTFVAPMDELNKPNPSPSLKGRGKKSNSDPSRKGQSGKVPSTKSKAAPNEIRPDAIDDMALEAMIHDMLEEGKPSSYLLDFIKMMRKKPAQDKPAQDKPAQGKPTTSSPSPSQAGERWMVEDDLRLRELFQEGTPIAQLARDFNRTYGSIRARLKKLGLIE
jgi:hypothetical protein